MFFRSERLFLRPCWPEDWEDLYRLIANPEIVRNLTRAPWPYKVEDAREFVLREPRRMLPHFLVTVPGAAGARTIGSIGLDNDAGRTELGYWIARDHWGRGYATEAASAVLRMAAALGHRQLFAGHFADNPASGRVLVKAGFQPTGDVRRRFSRGRGQEVASVEYAIELGGCCGEGGEDDDGGTGPDDRIAA